MKAEFHGLLEEHTEGLRKPLYLQGRQGLAVDLDGPALRIEQPERAVTFYPLARLARVLSKGEVRWAYEALLACADAGVPVVFMDGEGGVRGYFFGRSASKDDLYRCLQSSLRRSDGLYRYRHWRTMMTVHAQHALRRQLQQAGIDPDLVFVTQPMATIEKTAAYKATAIQLNTRLFGLLAGLSAQLWVEAGLNAKRWVDLEPLPLVDDLAGLLGWALVEPLLLTSSTRFQSGLDWRDERGLTALVEGRRDELLQFGRLLLDQLRQWLTED